MSFIFHHQPRRLHFLKRGWVVVYVSILVAVLQGLARGAAFELYETGAPDLGTASAGRAAMAADASTVAANPAGMALLDRSQLLWASGALLPTTNFDIAPQTTTKGTAGGNAGVFTPIGAFFYAHKFSERVWFGVALYSDYGLGGNYSTQWVGRYYVSKEALFTGKVAPSIAYQVNESSRPRNFASDSPINHRNITSLASDRSSRTSVRVSQLSARESAEHKSMSP